MSKDRGELPGQTAFDLTKSRPQAHRLTEPPQTSSELRRLSREMIEIAKRVRQTFGEGQMTAEQKASNVRAIQDKVSLFRLEAIKDRPRLFQDLPDTAYILLDPPVDPQVNMQAYYLVKEGVIVYAPVHKVTREVDKWPPGKKEPDLINEPDFSQKIETIHPQEWLKQAINVSNGLTNFVIGGAIPHSIPIP